MNEFYFEIENIFQDVGTLDLSLGGGSKGSLGKSTYTQYYCYWPTDVGSGYVYTYVLSWVVNNVHFKGI